MFAPLASCCGGPQPGAPISPGGCLLDAPKLPPFPPLLLTADTALLKRTFPLFLPPPSLALKDLHVIPPSLTRSYARRSIGAGAAAALCVARTLWMFAFTLFSCACSHRSRSRLSSSSAQLIVLRSFFVWPRSNEMSHSNLLIRLLSLVISRSCSLFSLVEIVVPIVHYALRVLPSVVDKPVYFVLFVGVQS